jgi:leucyl aminopeptidase
MPLDVSARAEIPDGAALGVLVTEEMATTSAVDVAPLTANGFRGKLGETSAFNVGPRPGMAVGLGPGGELSSPQVRHAAGALARAAGHVPVLAIEVNGSLNVDVQAITEGLILGAYEYTALKSRPSERRLTEAFLVTDRPAAVADALRRGTVLAAAVCLTRDLVNEPGGSLTPERFAEIAVAQGDTWGFGVDVWTEDRIRGERLGGLLGVNRGSARPPRLVELRYGAGAGAPVVVCGKGVTFDSGGLSLKTTAGMTAMKGDMAGAAAVLGLFTAIAQLGSEVNVVGLLPLTDNMPGPDATRVGDVLTIRNGKTVEVLNTDAEGRLILADALALASERNPAAIVDLATLTGACIVALGDGLAGVMGNDDALVAAIQASATATGEEVWPLPLPSKLRPRLDSDVADLRNVAESRYGGAVLAGLFLQEFVADGLPWAHLDIAGPAHSDEADGELPKGGTGFGVRLLVDLVETMGSRPPLTMEA